LRCGDEPEMANVKPKLPATPIPTVEQGADTDAE
jgi:hypothetical protein